MAELVCRDEHVELLPEGGNRAPLQLFRDVERANPERKVYWVVGVDSLPAMEQRRPAFFNEVKFLVIPSQGYAIRDSHRYRGNLEVTKDKITPMQSGLARKILATYKKHKTDLASFERFVSEFGYLDSNVVYYIDQHDLVY
jgi:nicotinic acid mononucleotide adenylyltransferase